MENTGQSLGRIERRNSYRDLHCKPERLAMGDWCCSTSVFSSNTGYAVHTNCDHCDPCDHCDDWPPCDACDHYDTCDLCDACDHWDACDDWHPCDACDPIDHYDPCDLCDACDHYDPCDLCDACDHCDACDKWSRLASSPSLPQKSPVRTTNTLNPFTPKSVQFQISRAASPEILRHKVWRTWFS